MLWWWEWVDQGDRWKPFRALKGFVAGEDLRGKDANTWPLEAAAPAGRLWSRRGPRNASRSSAIAMSAESSGYSSARATIN